MTKKELYTEIKRIDGFIEVLQDFLRDPACKCISHANNTVQKFTQENKEQLQTLIHIRNFLLPLQSESDANLAKISYKPVQFSCYENER